MPPGWIPDSVVLEGMFLIQTSPLPNMSSMKEYVKLLLFRFVRPHFSAGVKEVHVVFDNPGSQEETPKELEKARRDKAAEIQMSTHHCMSFCSELLVPDKWRSILSCRKCKMNLTSYVADDMLNAMFTSSKPRIDCQHWADSFQSHIPK